MKPLHKISLLFPTLLLICLCIISACSSEPTEAPAVQIVIPQIGELLFSETVTSQAEETVNGDIIIEYDIRIPQIDNADENQALLLINEHYQKIYRDLMEYGYQQAYNFARNDYEDARDNPDYQFMPHGYGVSFDVTYKQDHLLSVVLHEYTYTGGAHPSTYRSATVFDIRTGEIAYLADLLDMQEEEAREFVLARIAAQIESDIQNDEMYVFEDYMDYFRQSLSSHDFYLEPGYLVLYYQQYAIAPYAAGFPEFRIPLSEIEAFSQY